MNGIETLDAILERMQASDIVELEYEEEDGVKLKIRRALEPVVQAAPVVQIPKAAPAAAPETELGYSDVTEVKAPMVGVFYNAAAPDKDPFVKIGDRVKKGDVLCIIEAMKLMNEITAEQDGEIVDICAANEQIVEFGQTIFKMI